MPKTQGTVETEPADPVKKPRRRKATAGTEAATGDTAAANGAAANGAAANGHRTRSYTMSPGHKASLAEGRESGRAVRRYLEALETSKPRRGRPRNPERTQARLAEVERMLPSVDALTRLHLMQERMDLEAELAMTVEEPDLSELEADFIAHARSYSDRKGISYQAWRAAGVERRVLREAGIVR